MCLSIIQEGENSKIQGDVFRFDIDTLKQNNDSVFEDFYINAIGKYRQINYYKDSISAKIYLNARLIVLAFALSMPISIWGQCASIYQKGETYMKRGRYRDAIKSFKAAMKCDSNLEQACKNKIKECEEKINPAPKPAPPAEITRLTIDRKSREFGCVK